MIGLLAMVITTVVALIMSYSLTVKRPFSPTALFHFLFAALILFRPVLFLLGLEKPFPDELFIGTPMGLFADTLGVSLIWLVGFVVGNLVTENRTKSIRWLLPSAEGISQRSIRRTAILMTAVAVLTTGYQAVRLGGPAVLIRATKVEKLTGDILLLRSFAVVSTVFSLAYLLFEIAKVDGSEKRMFRRRLMAFVLVVLSASCSFTWGARDSAVIALVGLAIGPLALKLRLRSRSVRILLGGGIAVGSVVGLRMARDVLTFDTVSNPLADQSLLRQTSVAANLTKFDSFALAIRDWPGDRQYRFGADFWDGLLAAIPPFRPPEYERTALWWAREYEPGRANGYPLTSIGEWFLNFGVIGVLFGGFLAGWLYRALDDQYRTGKLSGPLNVAISILLIISFVRLGPWTSMPVVYRTMVLPTFLVTTYLRFISRRRTLVEEARPRAKRRARASRSGRSATAPGEIDSVRSEVELPDPRVDA